MLPHQKAKVDISSLTEDEQRLFRLYGKLPSKKDILKNKLKERKYFDSGDYALSKAGKASDVGVTNIGSQHPLPENIPHHAASGTPTGTGNSSSPIKESSLLHAKSPMGSQQPIEGEELSSANSAEEEEKAAAAAAAATSSAEKTTPEVAPIGASAVPFTSH